jgi:TP53 regulating kinase and related kinases
MEEKLKLIFEPGESVETNNGSLKIIKSLGKGKSGYSYLAESEHKNLVLKVMHDEPVPYYSFEIDKVASESNAYELLKALNIPVPEMYTASLKGNYLIKEYIPGITGAEWIIGHNEGESVISQLFDMANTMERNKFNLDYFPSNFVINDDQLFYVDYEVNNYNPEWDLKNWGIYYWANKEGFRKFLKEGDASAINIDVNKGLPIKGPFEDQVMEWIDKYAM